jgi:hypothetical protein
MLDRTYYCNGKVLAGDLMGYFRCTPVNNVSQRLGTPYLSKYLWFAGGRVGDIVDNAGAVNIQCSKTYPSQSTTFRKPQ